MSLAIQKPRVAGRGVKGSSSYPVHLQPVKGNDLYQRRNKVRKEAEVPQIPDEYETEETVQGLPVFMCDDEKNMRSLSSPSTQSSPLTTKGSL